MKLCAMTTVDSPETTISPTLRQAFLLLRTSIYRDLDYAECLTGLDWDDDNINLVRKAIDDLVTVVRGLVAQHESTDTGKCISCNVPWPCTMTEHIYALVKEPTRTFKEIMDYIRREHEN
jgi:hypothetical protein